MRNKYKPYGTGLASICATARLETIFHNPAGPQLPPLQKKAGKARPIPTRWPAGQLLSVTRALLLCNC